MKKLFVTTLSLLLYLSSYSQWTANQKDAFIAAYSKELSDNMQMSKEDQKVIAECIFSKFVLKFPKPDNLNKVTKDSLFKINKKIGSECAKENMSSLKSLVVSWDNITTERLKEVAGSVKEFKIFMPEYRERLTILMFEEIKVLYPKGFPVNLSEKDLEVVASRSVQRLLKEVK